jgi:hypothetical protein
MLNYDIHISITDTEKDNFFLSLTEWIFQNTQKNKDEHRKNNKL